MSGRRRKSRELALQLLYQNDLAGTPADEMFVRTDEYLNAKPEVQEYASRLVLGTLSRRDELDAKLSERSEHWRLGRMPAVDRNLLRLALFELLYEEDTPDAVVIDEAVEIAKKFSTPSSGPFVNGVLDAIRRATFGPRAKRPPAVVVLLVLLASAAPAARSLGTESARYRVSGAAPWTELRAVEGPGYRIALAAPDGVTLEAVVEVDESPLPDDAPFPVAKDVLALGVGALPEVAPDPEADALSRMITRGSSTVLEAIDRVVAFTSRRIRYELPTGVAETAASCRARRRGSCVGRSLLAADLLARAGIPARQVTGILAAGRPEELTPDTRAVYSASLGGVRHRWIEAWVPRLGWVPSDPGGLANAVSTRHVALARPPDPDFGLRIGSRTAQLTWPPIAGLGRGVTLARPRGSSLVVTNAAA